MSSHREAPEIAKDPVADSSDLYAFVSPDKPDTVTLIANYVPLQLPVRWARTSSSSVTTCSTRSTSTTTATAGRTSPTGSEFTTEITNRTAFLYNTGPIDSLDSTNWNRRQFYGRPGCRRHGEHRLAHKLPCPPCNVGPLSTPKYAKLVRQAPSQAVQRRAGLRRAARRRLLRRPGRDLRPRHAAAVPATARGRARRSSRPRASGQRHRPDERAQHRHPGADWTTVRRRAKPVRSRP